MFGAAQMLSEPGSETAWPLGVVHTTLAGLRLDIEIATREHQAACPASVASVIP